MTIKQDDVWAICDAVTEAQALVEDAHNRQPMHSAINKIRAALSDPSLLEAMHSVEYFPRNTPPGTGRLPITLPKGVIV